MLYGNHAVTSPRSLYASEMCKSRMASTFSGQWPLSQGFRCCHSVHNGFYTGIRVSQAPIRRMNSKYANLESLALPLANGHCHSTWGEKRLKHEFQSGMLPAVHGICPRHAHNVPKLRRDFVLILVLRIVATVTATRNDATYIYMDPLGLMNPWGSDLRGSGPQDCRPCRRPMSKLYTL